jgi:hypothetical protein
MFGDVLAGSGARGFADSGFAGLPRRSACGLRRAKAGSVSLDRRQAPRVTSDRRCETAGNATGEEMMSAILKKSLAASVEERGFGVLCVRDSQAERFIIIPAEKANAADLIQQGLRLWELVSEADALAQLTLAGLTESDIDAVMNLAREWATTVTRKPGSPHVLWSR